MLPPCMSYRREAAISNAKITGITGVCFCDASNMLPVIAVIDSGVLLQYLGDTMVYHLLDYRGGNDG